MANPTSPSLSQAAQSIRQSVFARLAPHIASRREAGEVLVPLQIGDTHLLPVSEALQPAQMDDISLYGPIAGLPDLNEALATHRRAAGLTTAVSGDHIHLACGCTHALFCAARAVLDPGDEVLIASPYWPLIPGVLRSAGAVPVEVPISQAMFADPSLDVAAALERHRTERTRAVYYITPNNPDGFVWPREAVEAVARFSLQHDLWVLADEVYADYVYDGEHHSAANLPGMADRTITAFSLSKSHGIAGARIGYVVASQEVIAACRRISNHTLYNVPVAMQRAALAAVQGGDDWMVAARQSYRQARDASSAVLSEAGIPFTPAPGGSFIFADLSAPLDGRPLQGLLEAAIAEGVLVAPGEVFGEGFERHVRLCFTGVSEAEVVDGLRRLVRATQTF